MSAEPVRDHIVVVFGGGASGWCELSHCPMHAHGPYTFSQAHAVAAELPSWMQPHVIGIASDLDACLRTRIQI